MDAPGLDTAHQQSATSSSSSSSNTSAPTNPQTAVLDREMFQETLNLVALRIPQRMTEPLLKRLGGGYLLSRPKVKVVIPDLGTTSGTSSTTATATPTKGDSRLLLLSETVTEPDLRQLPEEVRGYVLENAEVTRYTLHLGYPHLSLEQVLRRVLPPGLPAVSSFETIGHIAHLNLRDEHLPYRHLIGQVILDKNPRLRSVVNKTHGINTTFRTFAMEVIAGQEDLDTEVSESRCRFAFNYGQVYWNSRLQAEHERLLKKLKPADIVCDMFAGVGPFAVPAARNTGCQVYANDLNPKSYEALVSNALRNKVQQLVRAHNMDARDFVRALYKETPPVPFTQVIMNLPASAESFLDVFREFPAELKPPTIHCYVFTKDTIDPRADVVKRVESVLQCALEEREVYEVRDVSPKKLMMCVSFPLPRAAYSHPAHEEEAAAAEDGRGAKRKEPDVPDAPAPAREVDGEEREEEGEEEEEEAAGDRAVPPRPKKPKA